MNARVSMVFILALLVAAAGCSKNTREKSVTLSETASCSVPQFSRPEGGTLIEIKFVERVSGERELMTQDCTTYLTHTQKMLANSGRKLGQGKVVGNAVGTAILLPFTVIGDVFQFGGKKSRTRCKGWVLKETENFEEHVSKSARFKGDLTLVSVENPDDAQTRTIDKAAETLTFPVDSAEENFLLHIQGKYTTDSNTCDVDQQILLQGKASEAPSETP